MTIVELKNSKQELEQTIKQYIEAFEENTGLKIKSIDINHAALNTERDILLKRYIMQITTHITID